MNGRHLARSAAVLALGLVAVACSGGPGGGGASSNQPSTLTVWLMNGSAPPSIVDGVNADFKARHPNVKVDVQIQQWSDVTTKLDTAFAGGAPPDVVELGNTLVAKYAAAGALSNVTSKKADFENSSTWLQSLTDSCTLSGKLYCVPYYAGSRAVVYRKDMFDRAGVKPPASTDEWLQIGQKLMDTNRSDADFSALYYPGKYWYAALPFVWDMGGDIATQSGGQWKGTLDSPSSQQGLTTLANMVGKLSRADKTGDELKQDAAFVQGHIAMLVANGWEIGVITDPKTGDPSLKDKLGVFPIPSHTAGQTAPVFLGGSDLGIAARSRAQDLAQEWVGLLTGKKWQTQMATVGLVIPNTTALLSANDGQPLIGTFASAARNSRFVPNSPNWANVESANVIPDMLVSIFTGKASVADATKSASGQVTQILNGKS
ncbi:MAG TPA: sugar ABC transporter substrate-binding protein [Candidatus Dormibacteraeota bacterium]